MNEKNNGNNILDDYKLLETIGEGTFGKVKLAIHKQTNQEVAIKIFEKKNFFSSKDIIYFQKEIAILKKLNHPNIINIYNIIENDSHFYIIMEYASKGDLFKYIVNKKRLDEKEAAYFYCQLIYGLEFIHQNNISHRDLKPENLLIKENNILAIIDFGLSIEFNNNELLSTPCGSPSYAAPEMILGKKYDGESIDIWSSGITLYVMVCGNLPFKEKTKEALYKKILTYNYDLPYFLSDNCKDLITKILCNKKKRINIEEIKNHPFLIESFNKYNPKEQIFYNPYNIYNKIVEIMVDNYPEYNYKKEDIINSIKNKEFNNISTTYKLLMKKMIFKENEREQNVLFTKSSTDSCITTNNISNLVNRCIYPFFEERKKTNNNNINEKINNNNSKNDKIKLNNEIKNDSPYLTIQTKIDANQNNNDDNNIYTYYVQKNPQTIKRRNDNININSKHKKESTNINEKRYNIYRNTFEFENNSIFNANSSKEISKYRKGLENKSGDKKINNKQKNIKIISQNFEQIFNHKQNIYSNDIYNYNVSEKNEFEKEIENKKSLNNLSHKSRNKEINIKKNNQVDNNFSSNCQTKKIVINKSKTFKDNNKKNIIYLNKNQDKKNMINSKKERKEKLSLNQNSWIFNNNQSTIPQNKNASKQKYIKIKNLKEKTFSQRYSPNPPPMHSKINTEKKKYFVKRQSLKYEYELNSKIKTSFNNQLISNSSHKRINTENLFNKNDNKINYTKKKTKKEDKNISNKKTYYPIGKQKTTIQSSNIIKNDKKQKNCNLKKSTNLAINPFNLSINNNIYEVDKNTVKSFSNIYSIFNNNNNNNLSKSINSTTIPSNISSKPIFENKIIKFKDLNNKSLNSFYKYKNEQKRKEQSLSIKNIKKIKSQEKNIYNNNTLKRNIFNTIKNIHNDSYCSENYMIKKRTKKNNDNYNKNTFDSKSKDFAVCNTNLSLEEINEKLIQLSKNKNFSLNKIDLLNYICSKNKNNSIKIEITSKGNSNMMKIYYLEGKENITKELIKNIIFSIGF